MDAKIFRNALLAIILACATVLPANAGMIVFGTDPAHLAETSNPLYDSGGYVRGVDSAGSGFIAGGFNLVHPEWALSLTHVAQGYLAVQGGFEPDARDPNRVLHAIDYWIPSPNSDLALLHFAQPILNRPLAEIYFGEVPVGTHFTYAGYGRLAYPGEGEISLAGTKRGGENIITDFGLVPGLFDGYAIYEFNPLTGGASLPLEMSATHGDSGSGLFGEWEGRNKLFALNAVEFAGFSSAGALLLGPEEDFIRAHVPLSSVPEPSGLAILTSIIPMLLLTRRFQRPLVPLEGRQF